MTRNATDMSATITLSRRKGTGSGHPLWMRTLEEKYQKLHKKIIENTGNARFSNSVGRSVYDGRISQALKRYKTIANKSLRKVNEINGQDESNVNSDNEIVDLPPNISNENSPNQYLDNCDTNIVDNEMCANCEEGVDNNSKSKSASPICDQTVEVHRAQSEASDVSKHHENHEKSLNETEVILKVVDTENYTIGCDKDTDFVPTPQAVPRLKFDKSENKIERGADIAKPSRYDRKNLKTSISRTSKITSKSCPAKIQNQVNRNHGQKTLLTSRSKSVNRHKMFTPMSAEAKHAITETIQEMNITASSQTDGEVNFVPIRSRTCVRNWHTPKRTKELLNYRVVLDSTAERLANIDCDGVNLNSAEKQNSGNGGSCRSSAGSGTLSSARGLGEAKLPDILSGSARDRYQGKKQSYILPGIGKYRISHDEPVFEITPPGFDSRYNDVMPHEERESETPPPDIRQRAIDKCSAWLIKYNK
ncbi:uncharacterized protein LOC127854997 [Dreissena polymorpha]|uniref:Uncharacterized protein n=1 Tax=Dreissena polymorpha TaxID=45954 RepID=A0A9D4C8W2_DREPO|nr:uncharacterized protein LOC127854997 [Dreissena polymorpha]XP_052246192.1 uncharacterized protein LOC127854997 [Dreissena polymorpha]XP_052246193.1 uncharacterized protein LOC127854997 [Dreissena polymorpha]XP_052246194.1 uncharacterized protein LOC127854997 [Dreissena polymorpha]XP_052246195.1 uncharacterized protein LOC127854997 [Dreissena polymorpha]KAH3719395.1 hypothetical protein DPMN_062227 [Dreissena polymorpha]